ncbi:hypothetical protein GC176_10030 [bacterium]|nr:hypothetical protein [bacterium]
MTYKLDFRADEDDTYVLRLIDLDIVAFNAKPLTAETKNNLQPDIDAFNAMPSFVVNSSGQMSDVLGLDGLIDAAGKTTERGRSDGASRNFAEALHNDRFREFFTRALSAYWTCWVEGWIDFPANPGDSVSVDFEEPMMPGVAPVNGRRTYQNLGAVPESPGLLHLRNETIIQDPSFTKAIVEMIRGLDEANRRFPDPELDTIPEMFGQTVIESKIDPTTLRPVWAKRTKIMRVDSDDPQYAPLNRFESHEYTFHWD